jgi:hypothetical protein
MPAAKFSAEEVLAFARSGGSNAYDVIGFRTVVAAAHVRGALPLRTLEQAKGVLESIEQSRPSDAIDELVNLRQRVRHQPLELSPEGSLRYEIGPGTARFMWTDAGGREQARTFSLAHPPQFMLKDVRDDDAPLLVTQSREIEIPGIRWLPLRSLIQLGHFPRMQDRPDLLVHRTHPGSFYAFISHRWLTPELADPNGLQAALVAWQLVTHLIEAVRIAHARGLHNPRRRNVYLNAFVGAHGPELSEALLTNVLRFAAEKELPAALMEELDAFADVEDDFGVSAARGDLGLNRLRSLLAAAPLLSELIGRIQLWYDYSCMPQHPRTEQEQVQFEIGLRSLDVCQVLGKTIILLDHILSYLGRAWCTHEAVFATAFLNQDLGMLVGSATGRIDQKSEFEFFNVLQDRPHLIWRGLLDTEVFRIQSPRECMTRLGLDTTRPDDVLLVYGMLRNMGAPRQVHIDGSELLTGALALPAVGDAVRLTKGTSFAVDEPPGAAAPTFQSLDWTGALRIESAWRSELNAADLPAWLPMRAEAAARRGCHVAIMASCEGEAVLFMQWTRDHRQELEALLSVSIESVSRLASDVAPVGRLLGGSLTIKPVRAEVWVVIASSVRFERSGTTRRLLDTLRLSGVEHVQVAIDLSEHNVMRHAASEPVDGPEIAAVRIDGDLFAAYPAGLFRGELDWILPQQDQGA